MVALPVPAASGGGVREKIIETTVGFKLRSKAIHG
jgi:hypothetical protein